MVLYPIACIVLAIAATSSLDAVSARVDDNTIVTAPTSHNIVLEEEPPKYDPPGRGSLVAMQFTADPHAGRDRLEMTRTGELGLIGLRYMPTSFGEGVGDESYADVYGEFCAFDPGLHKLDPSHYPSVREVALESSHCNDHRETMPLRDVMDAVDGDDSARAVPLGGMLFHQGHSGAGLLSNALAAFDSALVVSEHPALRDALGACDTIRNRHGSGDCSARKQRRLVRDVVALVSRTSNGDADRLFLKLHVSSAVYLPILVELYPDARWTFSYRVAEVVLSKNMQRGRSVACVKARRNPTTALSEKSAENNLDLEGLSRHEVCALHLSTLLEAALREHERTGAGMLVSYDDIVSSSGRNIVEEVLPYLGLQGEMNSDPELITRVLGILSTRSNSRGKGSTQWDKSEEENIEILEEVRNAVKLFMGELMVESSERYSNVDE